MVPAEAGYGAISAGQDSISEEYQHHARFGFGTCASECLGRMRRTGRNSFNMTVGSK